MAIICRKIVQRTIKMKKPDIPINEKERLNALYSYELLDNIEQKEFNDIVNLAAQICDTPISLITLIDASTQWHKARFGLDVADIEREISFCGHAINQPDEIFIVDDASKDERFADNPLVKGDPKIVFYAGVPLVTHDGLPLGALCVIDQVPKVLEPHQISALKTLSQQVIRLFELRKLVLDYDKKYSQLEENQQNFEKIGHHLKAHLRKMEVSVEVIKRKHEGNFDDECSTLINAIQTEATNAIQLINDEIYKADDS